jgi:hypothetical protein
MSRAPVPTLRAVPPTARAINIQIAASRRPSARNSRTVRPGPRDAGLRGAARCEPADERDRDADEREEVDRDELDRDVVDRDVVERGRAGAFVAIPGR